MRNRANFETVHGRRGNHLRAWFEAAMPKAFEGFTVGMTEPEASTGGGVRARQNVVLTTSAGVALVVGWANAADKTAELRTLGHVLAVGKERFGVEPAIATR